jgi:hypothetical protein
MVLKFLYTYSSVADLNPFGPISFPQIQIRDPFQSFLGSVSGYYFNEDQNQLEGKI